MYQVSFGNNKTRGKKITEVFGRKTGCFLVNWQPGKTTKKHTRPPLHCFAYRKESEYLCNLIVYTWRIPQCSMASTNPCSIVWCKYCFTVSAIHFCIRKLAHRSLCFFFFFTIFLFSKLIDWPVFNLHNLQSKGTSLMQNQGPHKNWDEFHS